MLHASDLVRLETSEVGSQLFEKRQVSKPGTSGPQVYDDADFHGDAGGDHGNDGSLQFL